MAMMTSSFAFASGDTTFSAMSDWIIDKLSGSGGLLLAIIALVIAVVSALSGYFKMFAISLVVIIAATLGPGIISGFFTATF